MHIRADLHLHTRASDGELTSDQVSSLAQFSGLEAIALTDHDTLSGARQADELTRKFDIRVIPGVEISIAYDPGTLHILGYFPTFPEAFEKALERLQQARVVRLPKMIEKLRALGMEISESEVTDIAREGQIGRPHVAKALLRKGYVRDFEEAFTRYLGKGKPAYVEKDRMGSAEAIEAILSHGGLPVLAHPVTLNLPKAEVKGFIQGLADQGLKGIEIFYPDHTRAQKKMYIEISRELGLLATGGTDFHSLTPGGVKPGAYGLDKNGLAAFEGRLYGA